MQKTISIKTESESNLFYQIYKSPVGKIYIVSSENFLAGIHFENEINSIDLKNCRVKTTAETDKALEFLSEYFSSGKKSNLNKIAAGINFNFSLYTSNEIKIYKKLLKIDFGKIISYKELGIKCGFPRGARFIGNCMAKNRFPVIIPCHRIIKSDGSIGNYSGGAGIKEELLKHEGVIVL